MLNVVELIGNLGRAPDLRHTADGTPVANLSVATSEKWKDKHTGEQKERTEWHRVVLWRNLAEIASKYLDKGSKVYLRGQLQTRKWQDQDGNDRYTTEVVLSGFDAKLVMLDGKGRRDDDERAAEPGDQSPGADLDDEIPF